MLRINERHAVKETLRIAVGELQFPRLADVKMVNSRFVTGTCGKQKDFGAERFHAAKIERVCAGDLALVPSGPAVLRDKVRSVGAASPNIIAIKDADAAKILSGMALLRLPLGEGGGGEQENEAEAHAGRIRDAGVRVPPRSAGGFELTGLCCTGEDARASMTLKADG